MMTNDPEPLRKALEDAVRKAVSGKDVAVAFSGGLDSGLVAVLSEEYAKRTTLYTVGTKSSHDVKEATLMADELGMRLVTLPIAEDDVIQGLRDIIRITGSKDPITLSFEIPLFFVCKLSQEREVIGGQGADELFAGYSKYIGLNDAELKMMIAEDTKKLKEITIPLERKIAEHFGKRIHHPFLDEEVVKEAGILDVGRTVNTDDPISRKKALREVSGSMGYNSLSMKEKKSAQYSSGAMAMIKKVCKEQNKTYAELIESLSTEVS